MATEKQIEANRRNSQHSTGPRSEAGKAVSRVNALKSGLYAESLIIRSEDPEAYARLTDEYYAEFQPVAARQRDLVDTLVHNQWLIRRLRLTEADLYAVHFQCHDDDFDPKWRHHVLAREHPLADGFSSLEKRLLRLQSRLNSLERSNRLALKELSGVGLLACQPAEGRQDFETMLPSPETTEGSPLRNGFVPSNPEDRAQASPEPPSPSPQSRTPHPEPPVGFVPSNPPQSLIPDPGPLIPAERSEVSARPIFGHLPLRAIPVTDCTQTAYSLAAQVPEQPSR